MNKLYLSIKYSAVPEFLVFTVGVVMFLAGVIGLASYLNFPSEVARIEATRAALDNADPYMSAGLLRDAVECNQDIAEQQRYNSLWWSGWAIPNGWADIKPIEIGGAR